MSKHDVWLRMLRLYSHFDMHIRLYEKFGTDADVEPDRQAYACPYFVSLKGILGNDWGVIVNPESERFGLLTFEHDDCGCIGPCPRGKQKRDEWLEKDQ